MPAADFLVTLAGTLREVVRPLEQALESPVELAALLRDHGWHIEGDAGPAVEILTQRLGFVDALPALEEAIGEAQRNMELGPAEATVLLDAAVALMDAVDAMKSSGPSAGTIPPLDRADFWTTFPADLAQSLVATYLELSQPALFAVLHLAGVIDRRRVPSDGTPGRVAYTKTELHWERLGQAITDPSALARDVYGWGETFDHDKLTDHVQRALYAFGIPVRRGLAWHPLVAAFYAANNPALVTLKDLRIPFVIRQDAQTRAELGLTLLPIPPKNQPTAAPVGVLIGPYAEGHFELTVPLGGIFDLELKGGLEADAALGVELRPGSVEPRLSATSTTLDAAATITAKPFEPWLPIGSPEGHRAELHDLLIGLEVKGPVTDPEVRVRLGTTQLSVIVDLRDGDGFQQKLLGTDTHNFTSAMAVVWSSKHGLTFEGSGSLAFDIPLNVSIGGVKISTLSLAIASEAETTKLTAAVTASATLGGLTVVVQGVGIALRLAPVAEAERPGNFGDLDLTFGFKPPDGLGVSIDAGGVRGGGFLRIGPDEGEYAGALELMFGDIGIKAIGDLTNRADGWSLLLLLYGQFPPIVLPFGFTLNGLGGLLGVQHGVDVDALIAAMKTPAFDDVLFPENPIRDAPRILGTLRTLFPYRLHALTIAPMVDIGWGRPRRLLFARFALVMQFDNALGTSASTSLSRVVLIGTLRVAIGPSKDDPDTTVVRLIVDVLGFWDRDKRRYGFLARLRDSRIASIDIFGGLGVWGEYGDHPRFLLSAGGFNPRFLDIPAEMSGIVERLGAAFSIGRFKIKLVGYFALTPGTIQAGADLSATGKVGPVGIKGVIGFDAIVYLEPSTHFIFDFRVQAEVSYKGHTLAGVKLTGTIQGPGQWIVSGEVTFSILWWDISKSFDESWGDAPLVETTATDVGALLTAELERAANWSAQLPTGGDAMVTLAPPPGELATLAHPLGRFVFSQRVVPLGLQLGRFGSGPVSGPSRFDVVSIAADQGSPPARQMVSEHFARAQFVDMNEEDRLTRPSFEALDAGVQFSSTAYHVPPSALAATMDYEPTAYLEIPGGATTHEEGTAGAGLDHAIVAVLGWQGAAGRAPMRLAERLALRTATLVTVSPPPLEVVDRTALVPSGAHALEDRARFASMLAEQRIAGGDGAAVQLVEAFELVGAG
jgi:hypothetical protein